MKKEEAFAILGEPPKLVPLSDNQVKIFIYLWNKYPDYINRQALVGRINDCYHNRSRYRSLLSDPADLAMFDQILNDDNTLF